MKVTKSSVSDWVPIKVEITLETKDEWGSFKTLFRDAWGMVSRNTKQEIFVEEICNALGINYEN